MNKRRIVCFLYNIKIFIYNKSNFLKIVYNAISISDDQYMAFNMIKIDYV